MVNSAKKIRQTVRKNIQKAVVNMHYTREQHYKSFIAELKSYSFINRLKFAIIILCSKRLKPKTDNKA